MADNVLQNTLTTAQSGTNLPEIPKGLQVPDSTGNLQTDIKNLQAVQQQPSMLLNFQKVMNATAKQAYNDRQSNELNTLGFDPTKVSGNVFGSIIGNLEQNRGMDVSRIFGATMQANNLVQQQITDRLEKAQELEESRRQFEENLKLEKKRIRLLEKENKEAAKIAKGEYNMKKKSWELEYAKAVKKLNTENQKATLYPDWDSYAGIYKSNNKDGTYDGYYVVDGKVYVTK